jgi:tungstate transport system substrate-binding protein
MLTSGSRVSTRLIMWKSLALSALLILTGCSSIMERRSASETLRIATTTSLDDSGLLDEILPDFEESHDVSTDVIAVGTGQAIVLGERGDVDVILVHAPELEQEFVDGGYGVDRTTFMTNPFILVGPHEDPANIGEADSAADALMRIANSESTFVSRGDDSGTHFKELSIWEEAGFEPDSGMDWYHAAGQGMGETLLTTNEMLGYTLTDRATFVAIEDEQVADLESLYGSPGQTGAGDALLDNPYSVIAVNPDTHEDTQIDLARDFIEWLTSEQTLQQISVYGEDQYGESLFTLLDV